MVTDPMKAIVDLRSRLSQRVARRGLRLADFLVRPGDPHSSRVVVEITEDFGKTEKERKEKLEEIKSLEESLRATSDDERTEKALTGLIEILEDPDKGILG